MGMAKKQTRRSVSLNRSAYEAAKLEAARRGMTLTALVESGLAAIGVAVVSHPQQSPALAERCASRRAASVAARSSKTSPKPPSHERQVLGNQIANACGFQ
jgi:hypothetical protein